MEQRGDYQYVAQHIFYCSLKFCVIQPSKIYAVVNYPSLQFFQDFSKCNFLIREFWIFYQVMLADRDSRQSSPVQTRRTVPILNVLSEGDFAKF